VIVGGAAGFRAQVADLAEELAWSPDYAPRLAARARELAATKKTQPLDAYRKAELATMRRNFFDPRQPYTRLRRAFVYKEKPAQTPPHLSGGRIHPGPSHPERSQRQEMITVLNR
jgi:putative two-component system hydrogenase maturation factor HypX/HoxX